MAKLIDPLKNYREVQTWNRRRKIIKDHVRKRGEVIGGGQSIKIQTGFMGRRTFDYDILSNKPKQSAQVLKKTLNKSAGINAYFVRPSKFHPSTKKVIHKGLDLIPNTTDDIPFVDISPPKPRMQTVNIDGIKHTSLSQEVKNKRTALADPTQFFRFKKDQEDIDRINASKRFRRL